jgi:hypothetical protein
MRWNSTGEVVVIAPRSGGEQIFLKCVIFLFENYYALGPVVAVAGS